MTTTTIDHKRAVAFRKMNSSSYVPTTSLKLDYRLLGSASGNALIVFVSLGQIVLLAEQEFLLPLSLAYSASPRAVAQWISCYLSCFRPLIMWRSFELAREHLQRAIVVIVQRRHQAPCSRISNIVQVLAYVKSATLRERGFKVRDRQNRMYKPLTLSNLTLSTTTIMDSSNPRFHASATIADSHVLGLGEDKEFCRFGLTVKPDIFVRETEGDHQWKGYHFRDASSILLPHGRRQWLSKSLSWSFSYCSAITV